MVQKPTFVFWKSLIVLILLYVTEDVMYKKISFEKVFFF